MSVLFNLKACPRCQSVVPMFSAPLTQEPGSVRRPNFVLDGIWSPGRYPVRGIAEFGGPHEHSRPGAPNTWRCELTGQHWSEPSQNPFPTLAPAGISVPRAVVQPKISAPGPQGARVSPLRQSNDVSCGQTSVAMGINALTGKKLTDMDISGGYGFQLLRALNEECKEAGYQWRDGGNFTNTCWPSLEKRLNKERTPVLIGLNGPLFSPSGRGHIVTLLSIDGQKVRYADPADGRIKVTSRRAIEQAPPHPDGKFFFYAARTQ